MYDHLFVFYAILQLSLDEIFSYDLLPIICLSACELWVLKNNFNIKRS